MAAAVTATSALPAPGGPATAGVAEIRPAPSAAEIERLRKQIRNSVLVVWSGARKFELPKPRLDSTGVWSADGTTYEKPRVAIFQTPDAVRFEPPPKPIAWSSIDSIAITGRGPGVGTVFLGIAGMGMVVGLPVAGVVVANATQAAGSGLLSTLVIMQAHWGYACEIRLRASGV